ncbi:thioester domain-containing protein [Yinghuangia aomiensis]
MLFTAGTATAEIGTTAKYDGSVDGTRGSVWLKVPVEGKPGAFEWRHPVTNLKKLKADGDVVKVYCIDLATKIKAASEYREGSWSDSWLNDSDKTRRINWVLNNSYPKIGDLDSLAGAAGIAKGQLDVPEAVAATQAAIWHYSNGAQLPGKDQQGDKQAAEILKLYTYLTGAKNTGIEEPKPSLRLEPNAAQGAPGDQPIGPPERGHQRHGSGDRQGQGPGARGCFARRQGRQAGRGREERHRAVREGPGRYGRGQAGGHRRDEDGDQHRPRVRRRTARTRRR